MESRSGKYNQKKNNLKEIDGYIIDSDISFGEGQFGKVYKAYYTKKPDKILACKVVERNRLVYDQYLSD